MNSDTVIAVAVLLALLSIVLAAPVLLVVALRAQKMLAGKEYPNLRLINKAARIWANAAQRTHETQARRTEQKNEDQSKPRHLNGSGSPQSAVNQNTRSVRIRVAAKTELDAWRVVKIVGKSINCDCAGFRDGICSHIDAVIVSGETAMVHPDDRDIARECSQQLRSLVEVPKAWKASWRRETKWRGLQVQPAPKRTHVRISDRPLVAFTGCKNRKAMIEEAKANGWDVTDEPSAHLDVLVAANPSANTNKIKAARISNVPIIHENDWSEVMVTGVIPN